MLQLLSESPPLAAAFALVFGLLVGSFLNVVILRLPRMLELQWQADAADLRGEATPAAEPFNLVTPRSRCPHCNHAIRPWENIPVISWLMPPVRSVRSTAVRVGKTIGGIAVTGGMSRAICSKIPPRAV